MTRAAITSAFLIGKQSAVGTPVSATKDIGLVRDSNLSLNREVHQSMALTSIGSQQITGHSVYGEGSVTVEFQHGRLLEYVFGAVAHATTSSDEKHTFTEANSAPYFTLEDSESAATDAVDTPYDCMIDQAEIKFGLNEVVLLTVNFKYTDKTTSTSATTAVESSLTVFPQWMQHITLNGTEADEVQEFTLTITKGVQQTHGLNSVLAQGVAATELKYEFSGKLGYTDTTYHQLMQGDTTTQEDISGVNVVINAHNAVTLGSGRRELKITLANCLFSKWEKSKSIGGLVFIDMAGTGTLSEAFSVDNIASGSW